MDEIQIKREPSGRCRCHICDKLIKENQVEIIKGVYRGNLNYSKYCNDCAIKSFLKLFPNLDIKRFKN